MLEKIKLIKKKLILNGGVFNEPISIDIIRAFEEKYKIFLPNELVLFYTVVCNGCHMHNELNIKPFQDLEFNPNKIYLDFPFKEKWMWEWEDIPPNIERLNQLENGNIKIIDLGCGLSWNIVVNGEEYGWIWSFGDVGISPSEPRLNFLQWFEFWLDNGFIYKNKSNFESNDFSL